MKKILLFTIISYFSVLGVFAQSLELSNASGKVNNGDTITMVSTDNNAVFAITMNVKNTSNSSIAVWCKKTELQIVSGSENYFCWSQCYLPNTFVSPDSIMIKSGETTTNFSGDYDSQGNAGVSVIRYTFFNKYNAKDSVCFVVRYIAGSGTGIDQASALAEVSNLFPNPARNTVSIDYDLKGANNGRLEIRNILGSLVKTVEVNQSKGTLKVDVSELTNGVYFYSFVVNEKVIVSKKLVIQH